MVVYHCRGFPLPPLAQLVRVAANAERPMERESCLKDTYLLDVPLQRPRRWVQSSRWSASLWAVSSMVRRPSGRRASDLLHLLRLPVTALQKPGSKGQFAISIAISIAIDLATGFNILLIRCLRVRLNNRKC